jgi:hypothetical protein
MVYQFRKWHFACLAAATATALVVVSMVQPVAAGSVKDLAGRWSGWGSVKLSNGATEQVKCVATYFVKNAGALINQNLRCASASYKIDAKANYNVKGNALTGEWEERTHSAKGNVQGRMTGNGFRLAVKGETFSARMIVTSSRCKQSINISPRGLDVSRISIGLKKC